jgi:colanic acid/amylovoran biosynthesis protein
MVGKNNLPDVLKSQKVLKLGFLVGTTCSNNKGDVAMLISATKTLRHFIPGSNVTFLSDRPELDSKNCSAYPVRVVGHKREVLKPVLRLFRPIIWISSLFGFDLHILLNRKTLQEYIHSDVIIDLRGDGFSDDYGCRSSFVSCYGILLCKFLNKPIVIYAQSIGPFKTKLTKSLSKFCLNRVDLLIVRDEITKNYLQKIGISNTIHFTADSAFLLEPSHYEKIRAILLKENIDISDRPIIGISASLLMYDRERKKNNQNSEKSYIILMAKTVDYLVERLNAQIVFVPHVTREESVDDRFVARKIYEIAKHKDKIRLINTAYSPVELKGIIGQCDLFIGARMHANIAATSMCVPTLAIAYSHKSSGIMRMLGMEKHVLDFRKVTFDEMTSRIDDLWINRVRIKTELEKKIPRVKEKAMLNGKLVKELLDSLNPRLSRNCF